MITENKGQQKHKHVLGAIIGGTVLGGCLTASFVGAFHEPTPHQVPVGVVAPAVVVHHLDAGVAAHAPGAMVFRRYSSSAAAEAAIRSGAEDAALVVGPGVTHLMVASAEGVAVTQALTQSLSKLTAASGQHLSVTDVVPLPKGDLLGLSPFFLVLTVLLPSIAVGAALALAAPDLGAGGALVGLGSFAVLLALADAWVSDGWLGALVGAPLALVGLAALLSAAIATTTSGLVRLLRAGGVAVAIVTFILVGIPATGGPVGLGRFVPGFYRSISSGLPASAALSAVRSVIYFGAHRLGGPLSVLAAWTLAGALLVVLAEVARRRSAARAQIRIAEAD